MLHRAWNQRCPDGSRTDTVNPDPEFELLIGEAAGEGNHGALGGSIVEEVGAADVGVDGGAVDDGVAGFHVLESVFADEENGMDVDVEGMEPLFSEWGNWSVRYHE